MFGLRNIARQTLLYSFLVVVVGIFIVLITNSSNWIALSFPQFPWWFIPLVSSIIVVSVGVVVLRRLRENDVIKSEFMNAVTHKFRTPLTHIKWASENLLAGKLSEAQTTEVGYIQHANSKLVELTNLLVNVAGSESNAFSYHIEKHDLSAVVADIVSSIQDQFTVKKIQWKLSIEPHIVVPCDDGRIKFVVQTFLENAVHYTPENSAISVRVNKEGDNAVCEVSDNGIGISAEDKRRLFEKFYRSHKATLTDTEGMGIGLYIVKQIIEHHGGTVWAESAGEGKGSRFGFSLKMK